MNLLLDTSTFLWITLDSPRLSATARRLFLDSSNQAYLSTASVWEIVVKHSLGKLPLPQSAPNFVPQQRIAHGILPLPLHEEAVLELPKLPDIHNDPFDRMLICQAMFHGFSLLTPDTNIRQYATVTTIW